MTEDNVLALYKFDEVKLFVYSELEKRGYSIIPTDWSQFNGAFVDNTRLTRNGNEYHVFISGRFDQTINFGIAEYSTIHNIYNNSIKYSNYRHSVTSALDLLDVHDIKRPLVPEY